MKKVFKTLMSLCALSLLFGNSFVASAQASDEPIITIHTNMYQAKGPGNQLLVVIGATDTTYIDVDCGDGKVEYEVVPAAYNPDTQEIEGTILSCMATEEGVIKIYGNAEEIDYLSARGCYISEISFPKLNLDVLDLQHNELKGLDVSHMSRLRALYTGDNTYSAETPLTIGSNHPNLQILEMSIVEHLDQSFNLSDYPKLVSFDAYHNVDLHKLDPTGCPDLLRLTLDVTNVASLDVSKNTKLMVLNISNTRIKNIDVTMLPYLTEFYCTHSGSFNCDYRLETIDVTQNPELQYFFCSDNLFKSIDISKNTKLVTFVARNNYLESLDVSNNPALYIVDIENNCLDFATLPFDPGVWNTYNYGQRNFSVNKSYPVNQTFDFSARVLREGTTTEAALYSVSEASPESPTLLDASYYTYKDGVVTMLKPTQDSVYIAFANNAFTHAILRTEKFIVKDDEEFNKPTNKFNFTTGVAVGNDLAFGVGVIGASPENPKEVYVDFGNMVCDTIQITTQNPVEPNIVGKKAGYGSITVYLPEGELLNAVYCKDIPMYSVDLSKAAEVSKVSIINAGLYSIDLSKNRCLTYLDLSNNKMSTISLAAGNQYYSKNVLSDINLSNNQLTSVVLNSHDAIENLNLSGNQLTEYNFSSSATFKKLDLSNNLFTELNFIYCYELDSVNISNNKLTSVILPESKILDYINCSNNNFTLATLPARNGLSEENFIYAPQNDLVIATKGPGIDLSEQYLTIGNDVTSYTWKDESGKVMTENVDYTCDKGLVKFINTKMGNIYCEMRHKAFPAFEGENVYKTTKVLAAEPPTNVIATFNTTEVGDSVVLSLAAKTAGTAIYFDWGGDNNLSQYLLETTYKLFGAKTKGNVKVNVYTYEPTEAITVFSMSDATLASFDGSKLNDAINISVYNSGLEAITLPENKEVLKELALPGNKFTEFDLSKYPNLTTVDLSNNQLSSIDLTQNQKLEVFAAAKNQMNDIKLNNDRLWMLSLDNNLFETFDLSNIKNIQQLTLSYNQLSNLDISQSKNLRALTISNNKFTFKTLPLPTPSLNVYYYQLQEDIKATCDENGIVDLSEQAMVGETPSVFTWYLEKPIYNYDTGMLEGEELIEGTEYSIENGVSKFLRTYNDVVCVITNEVFPNLDLYTTAVDVVAGVNDIVVDNAVSIVVSERNIYITSPNSSDEVALYNTTGALITSTTTVDGKATIENLSTGVYIVTVGNKSSKVIIK